MFKECCNSNSFLLQVVFFVAPQLSLKDEKCLLRVVKTSVDESGMAFYHLLLEGIAGGPGGEGKYFDYLQDL